MLRLLLAGTAATLVAAVDPKAAAAAMLARMTLDEKITLLHGGCDGNCYIGNTFAIPRLGIPHLTMNDGPQGFRSGGTTAFPSGLTAGASWDREAMRAWGEAMGQEFFDKGANVQLGPGVCVARVPRNGRNFEYLSGEDPYLGYELVQPAIQGIQSKGVIANAKHWVNNNQETDRSGGNEVVDERTRWEIYYPPFLGAIKAEVGSVMCSYNRVNGNYSCGNDETLNGDLKHRAGFEGWVMSDWGATHSTSINEGLDQEMPGQDFMGPALKAEVLSGKVSNATIDNSVSRILSQMYKFGLFDNVNQWNGSTHQHDVTSLAHSIVARNVSAAGTVLLKNEDGVLPLRPGQKLALIGIDSVDPVVHGGGSGSVEPMYVISPFAAISRRNTGQPAQSGPPPRPTAKCTILDKDADYYLPGSRSLGSGFHTAAACCDGCNKVNAPYFTWTGNSDNGCWCHTGVGQKNTRTGYMSGSTGAPPPPAPEPTLCRMIDANFDYNTPDSASMQGKFSSFDQCCVACGKDDPKWFFSTWINHADCWCHQTNNGKTSHPGAQSGSCRKLPPAPPAPRTDTVTTYTGADSTAAATVAAAADIAVVFVSTTSSEGSDRSTLSFSDAQNAVVDAVADAQKRTVVVMVNPGAVLTPCSEKVSALLTMFMPGLEMGNALSDVLFGDVNPSGRLSLTFPNKDNEMNFSQAQWPGVPVSTGLQSNYTERLEVGYRWYDAHKITPKYAFGHGLSYTTFRYSNLKIDGSKSVSITVTNTGKLDGAEIVQLYLGFPETAGEPPQVLRGFKKLHLQAGKSSTVTFQLGAGDFSTWDPQQHQWSEVGGEFFVSVGASSRDIRLTGTLTNTPVPRSRIELFH